MAIKFKKVYGDSDTPGKGFYVARFLDNTSVISLTNLINSSGLCQLDSLDINDLHCTVMYSRDHDTDKPYAPIRGTASAYVKEVVYWGGHDNSGYLVALLESSTLHRCFNEWERRGGKSSFPKYEPHVTLKHPFSFEEFDYAKAKRLKEQLVRKPLVIRMPYELIFELNRD